MLFVGEKEPRKRNFFGIIIPAPPKTHWLLSQEAINTAISQKRVRLKCKKCGYLHYEGDIDKCPKCKSKDFTPEY
ncbi:MAG: hypothetical protein QXO92_01070, partial [Candidatus Bathyarchaeia archaeon]